MLNKLEEVEKRYDYVSAQLQDPSVVSDQKQFRDLMREHKNLTPIIDKFKEYKTAIKQMAEAEELISASGEDKDLKELAREEFLACKEQSEKCAEELKILLIPKDPDDDKNVIVEIRSGVGGEEAALFAHSLFRMYQMYAEKQRWKVEVLSIDETELGGVKEVQFGISGANAFGRLKFESGVHRVQRVPETESAGRVQTSAATVAVLPEAEEVDVVINPADLQVDTYRAGGAGGQHVNKTESAIRITHVPTGTIVECQDERSQFQNREKAMRMLRAKLYEKQKMENDEARASARKSQVGSGDRSERIRTYNYQQGRMSDHRIGLTLYKLESFMDGDLDEMIDALITADQSEKLKGEANA